MIDIFCEMATQVDNVAEPLVESPEKVPRIFNHKNHHDDFGHLHVDDDDDYV